MHMKLTLADRVAIVTGAGRGIGRQTALKLAREGATVIANDLDASPLSELIDEHDGDAGAIVPIVEDVTSPRAPGLMLEAALDAGGLDIIVNNAGFPWDSVIQKTDDERWATMMEVHLGAPFRLLREAQPIISGFAKTERSEGRVRHRKVVNISSLAGVSGNAGQVAYSTAKAGVIGMTKTLAKEWGRYAVNVNVVAFGIVESRLSTVKAGTGASIQVNGREIPIGVSDEIAEATRNAVPLGRIGTADEGAGAVYMLCSPESDYVSGQLLICGGGYTL